MKIEKDHRSTARGSETGSQFTEQQMSEIFAAKIWMRLGRWGPAGHTTRARAHVCGRGGRGPWGSWVCGSWGAVVWRPGLGWAVWGPSCRLVEGIASCKHLHFFF